MKLFLSSISLLLFIWSINIESPISKKVSIYQPTTSILEMNWNKNFNGLWINENAQTRGISKCKISYEKNRFVVQMWGTCHPKDCDMGKNFTDEVENEITNFNLLWDAGFAESDVTYEIIDGKMKMTYNRHYKDNSGRQDYTSIDYFIKK